ncbi:ABC transporter permease [Galbitalea sp. SE-J8]|uniref:ABC transporter permease n=1 Tax=Galbitalea sp. SE-J8 TaxID=3054952 RepID=UPI00259D2FD7|nr:ABC transporter permease [Galbitalea sp. SE-J8]MDM4762679.1 ABC transporter permease [Galbitalea sp. SE-J8]
MIAAIRAETLKLTTTRLWWILLIVLVGYIGFTAGLLAFLFGALGDRMREQGGPAIDGVPALVYSTATAIGYVFPLIIGALAVTSEYRHQTLTPTFLATPRRATVLAAKTVVMAGTGAVFGVAGLVASVGLGASVLAATGTDAELGESDTWALIARVVVAMALWAVVGVGIGTLIPNQIASIVVVLAFTQFVEPILRLGSGVWDWTAQLGRFLPGAASDALVGSSIYTAFGGGSSVTLEWWQGGLVLLGLAVVLLAIGHLVSWRRDVT